MSQRHTLMRVVVALASLLLATTVSSVALPGTAHARCKGEGVRVTSTLEVNGATYVSETPVSGTCNANGTYGTNLRSHRSGWTAFMMIRLPGDIWRTVPFGAGIDPIYFELGPVPSNQFLMVLCAHNGTSVYCGWGDQYDLTVYPNTSTDHSGLNWGF